MSSGNSRNGCHDGLSLKRSNSPGSKTNYNSKPAECFPLTAQEEARKALRANPNADRIVVFSDGRQQVTCIRGHTVLLNSDEKLRSDQKEIWQCAQCLSQTLLSASLSKAQKQPEEPYVKRSPSSRLQTPEHRSPSSRCPEPTSSDTKQYRKVRSRHTTGYRYEIRLPSLSELLRSMNHKTYGTPKFVRSTYNRGSGFYSKE